MRRACVVWGIAKPESRALRPYTALVRLVYLLCGVVLAHVSVSDSLRYCSNVDDQAVRIVTFGGVAVVVAVVYPAGWYHFEGGELQACIAALNPAPGSPLHAALRRCLLLVGAAAMLGGPPVTAAAVYGLA